MESKDDCEVIRSIEKMESNLAILTKAYIEYANMGPLMSTSKKTLSTQAQKFLKNAKIVLVTSGFYLYGRGSTPEGFIPTNTR